MRRRHRQHLPQLDNHIYNSGSGAERMDGGSRNIQAYNLPLLTTYGGYDVPDPWCKYLCSKQDTRTQEHQDLTLAGTTKLNIKSII